MDDDFDDLIIIPSNLFAELKSGPLLDDGSLIFQVFTQVIAGQSKFVRPKASRNCN